MKVISKVSDIKKEIKELKRSGKSVGLVPTMGYLHEGHISLVSKSVSENDITVVSIFVNPTQFGPTEDLAAYPRDFERDSKMVESAGADIIFFPSPEEMYPDGACTKVSLTGITEVLCGITRPVHFAGVATVVTKLFNIVSPDRAYFGEKDYQQLQVIKRMVKDLNMDVEVIGMPIIREADGLAKSSRNIYLKGDERTSALALSKSFGIISDMVKAGEKDVKKIQQAVTDFIHSHPHTKVDYVEIVDPSDLRYLTRIEGDFVTALAVYVGKARLIDNKYFSGVIK
ncbi:MAG: pantoate--beta-alanine ligase [Deferribacterales bacterium]